jgi:hypothetical protein
MAKNGPCRYSDTNYRHQAGKPGGGYSGNLSEWMDFTQSLVWTGGQ